MTITDSTGNPVRFFKSILPTTTSYTFRHKKGLLFSTEFAQPALTIMERAQYMHLDARGLISSSALFAGHSLGEYTALSTIGDIMSFEKLLSVVFYRGLTMQAAVQRDANGLSRFAMVAVNPSRVNKALTTAKLQELVNAIARSSNDLLEVVNYNVDTQQYVCAGSLVCLDTLSTICTTLTQEPAHLTSPTALNTLITTTLANTLAQPQPITLVRGTATIPLEGIDVPFHSSFLLPKMPAFRQLLLDHISVEAIDPQRLLGKYVSNVTGRPFSIDYESVRDVAEMTGSSVLGELVEEMEGWDA